MLKKIILLSTIVLFSTCKREAEGSIYLIPEGFEGRVFIIYGVKEFKNKEYKDNKRLYRIPESGILKTNFKPNIGSSKSMEFYSYNIEDNSKKDKLPYHFSVNKTTIGNEKNLIIVSGMEQGKYKGFSFKMFTVKNHRRDNNKNIEKPYFVSDTLDKLLFTGNKR